MRLRHQDTAFGYGLAFAWGAAEAFLFFIVPDVLIGWLALRRGLRVGLLAAILAATGAAVGGAAMYGWSAASPSTARAAVEAVPAVSRPMVEAADAEMAREGWFAAAMRGPLTSTPFKVYAALAPGHGASLPAMVSATPLLRLPRFLAVAAVMALIGAAVRGRIDGRLVLAVFTGAWVLFYAWFWAAHAG